MILELTGVVEDGSRRGAGVPADPRRPLTLVRGSDVMLRLFVVNSAGEQEDTAGYEHIWTIKKKNNGILVKRAGIPVPSEAKNLVVFILTAAETTAFTPGQYVYDVWRINGGQEAIVPFSALAVEPALYPTTGGAITPSPLPPVPPPPPGPRLYNVEPGGVKDSVNLDFTVSPKYVPGREAVFLNGLRQKYGVSCDYVRVESGGPLTGYDTIQFTYPPRFSDSLLVDYDPAS